MEGKSGYTILFSKRAEEEIISSWNWYEERQQGLGDRFVKEVFIKVNLIERNPERYPERRQHFRETPVAVFPYLIIYRINKQKRSINIVSVFHTSLNPRKK